MALSVKQQQPLKLLHTAWGEEEQEEGAIYPRLSSAQCEKELVFLFVVVGSKHNQGIQLSLHGLS